MLGGLRYEAYGGADVNHMWINTLEETLEMVGMATFCYALLNFAEARMTSFSFQFVTGPSDAVPQNIEKYESKEVSPITQNLN